MFKSNVRKPMAKVWDQVARFIRLISNNIAVLVLWLLVGPFIGVAHPDESLNRQLAAIVGQEVPSDYAVSIQIADLGSGGVLMEMNPDVPLIPASTMKVITSAAALHTMNPDHRFITEVRADRIRGGSVGNLYIKGGGDPYLVTEELFRLSKALREKGLVEVRGDIVVDDSYFLPSRPVDENERLTWKSYHAPYGALSLNFNTVKLVVNSGPAVGAPADVQLSPLSEYSGLSSSVRTVKGKRSPRVSLDRIVDKRGHEIIKVSGLVGVNAKEKVIYVNVKEPRLYTGSVLKEMLLREGVRISGTVKKGKAPSGARKALEFESKPLAVIVYWLNKFSNNFIAEQLSMAMGAEKSGAPGTRKKGLQVMENFLLSCGAKKGTYKFVEASGLSRGNRLSASALVRVLLRSNRDFSYGPEFKASLSVGGVDGTLDNRFTDQKYKRRIRAKTGSLRGVTALAGYGVSPDGREFAFACLVNSVKDRAGFIYFADRIIERVLDMKLGRPLW